MNLRKDSVTGVIFDADVPAQLAAHPNHEPTSKGPGDTTIRKDYAVKDPSPIAGRIVREIK